MTAERGDPVTQCGRVRPAAGGLAGAPDEAVTAGIRFFRRSQVDDQLLGLVEVLHTTMVDL
jgi:hypothetical protein